MKIFRVLGLGLAIIMLQSLVPEIFHALESTFLSFFDVIQTFLVKTEDLSNSASLINLFQ